MFHLRLKFIAAMVFVMMLVVLTRLAQMQVLNADFYRQEARRRQIRTQVIVPPRGAVLARDGTVLAEDLPVRNVCVILNRLYGMPREDYRKWFSVIASIVDDSPDGAAARVQAAFGDVEADVSGSREDIASRRSPLDERRAKQAMAEARLIRKQKYSRPLPIYEDVGFRAAALAEVATADLDCLAVSESMKRKYPLGALAAHVVGYVGKSSEEEWYLYRYDYLGNERKRLFYDDLMGRAGVERQYNFELRGELGTREEVVNANNQTQKIVSDEPPQPGATIILSIDPVLQKAAEDALAVTLNNPKEPRPGAAVCMDVNTGEILVLASCPSYEPNTVSRDYANLTDPNGLGRLHPFQNRAVDSAYPLGSIFKVIVATAGLESGALTRSTSFNCQGVYHLGRNEFRCWISRPPYFGSHNSIDLMEALRVSCNIYFYNAGLKIGGPGLVEWAYGFGFGLPTGIDRYAENKGNVPTPRYPGEIVNLSIGQGELLATPLQVCRMIAAVANGGKLLAPRLRRETQPVAPANVGFSSATGSTLREALYSVVNTRGGTGYKYVRSSLITIAGKTGTAQAPPQGDMYGDHAWFAGFAPYENPQIAIAVVIEHGGYGGEKAGPVGKAIAEAYALEKGLAENVAAAEGAR